MYCQLKGKESMLTNLWKFAQLLKISDRTSSQSKRTACSVISGDELPIQSKLNFDCLRIWRTAKLNGCSVGPNPKLHWEVKHLAVGSCLFSGGCNIAAKEDSFLIRLVVCSG